MQTARNTKDSYQEVKAAGLLEFDAALTLEQADTFYRQCEGWRETERFVIAVLGKSKEQLLGRFPDNADVVLDVIVGMESYKKHLQAMIEATDTAMARLIIVCETFNAQGEARERAR